MYMRESSESLIDVPLKTNRPDFFHYRRHKYTVSALMGYENYESLLFPTNKLQKRLQIVTFSYEKVTKTKIRNFFASHSHSVRHETVDDKISMSGSTFRS